jgi:xeroderma pigmentosum group C-complementing protein
LQAYAEEEHWRNVQNERRREEQAISKWCQLLRAVATRQRLQDAYQGSRSASSAVPNNDYGTDAQLVPTTTSKPAESFGDETSVDVKPSCSIDDNSTLHEHSYPEENQSYDELTGVRIKTCPCGFVLTVEEM